MKYSSSFTYDLTVGEKGEDWVDLIFNKKEFIEVKTDRLAHKTGHIFIEYESRGKDSGITVTTAEWFVTYFKYFNEIWYIKSNKLRKLISENNFKTHTDSGDFGSNTKGYLIPRYQFKKYFKVRLVPKNLI